MLCAWAYCCENGTENVVSASCLLKTTSFYNKSPPKKFYDINEGFRSSFLEQLLLALVSVGIHTFICMFSS